MRPSRPRLLENYHRDEAIYYPRMVKMSFIGSYHRRPNQVPGMLIHKIELDQAIDRLPPVHRVAVRLRYCTEGIKMREALPLLAVSRSRFYKLLVEAVEMIADDLLERI